MVQLVRRPLLTQNKTIMSLSVNHHSSELKCTIMLWDIVLHRGKRPGQLHPVTVGAQRKQQQHSVVIVYIAAAGA